MTDTINENEYTPSRMPTKDYRDAQAKTYDPEFISAIGNQMRIPDRLHTHDDENSLHRQSLAMFSNHMVVPERILVAGEGQHIGARQNLQKLDLSDIPESEMAYVGLMTPPRTLTVDEAFPTLDDSEEKSKSNSFSQHVHTTPLANGGPAPKPYTPGISPNDSVLLNEEDEATLLRTQVAKLTRRMAVMEQDNQRRSQREVFLYPLVFGYFVLKMFSWFFRINK